MKRSLIPAVVPTLIAPWPDSSSCVYRTALHDLRRAGVITHREKSRFYSSAMIAYWQTKRGKHRG